MRVRLVVACLVLLFGACDRDPEPPRWQPQAITLEDETDDAGLASIRVEEVALKIATSHDQPTVVVFHTATCSRSRAFIESFSRTASQAENRFRVLALSVDRDKSVALPFLPGRAGVTNYWVVPWPPGTLSAAMEPLGITIGQSWGLPLVAVFGRDGRVVHAREGVSDAAAVNRALQSLEAIAP